MWLRREGDSDDPGTWHLVRTIRDTGFGSIYDPGLRGVKLLTVSFHDVRAKRQAEGRTPNTARIDALLDERVAAVDNTA
jgi:hypothetical protein